LSSRIVIVVIGEPRSTRGASYETRVATTTADACATSVGNVASGISSTIAPNAFVSQLVRPARDFRDRARELKRAKTRLFSRQFS
jgi:hypothetical protein